MALTQGKFRDAADMFERAFALRVADVFALTVLCGLNGMVFNEMVRLLRRLTIGWHVRMMAEAAA